MKLFSVDKTAAFAWSPGVEGPLFLATGTKAGAMDASFSSATELDFYAVESAIAPKKVGSTTVNARFHTLAWSQLGMQGAAGKSYGLLAGGKENGEVDIYDPYAIITGKTKDPVAKHAAFSGPVKGLDFSPLNPGMLATGGPDGEVLVFDLKSGAKPFRPAPKSNRIEDVSTLSWNQMADYILAVGSNNGSTVVYDLRGKREIMKLSYPGGRKQVTGLAWHPNLPTRIVTVNDDDSSPYVLTWDLRNASAPEQSFAGHEKGILSVSWCSRDPELLLTSSKDARTLIWDLSIGAPVGDLWQSSNWTFQTGFCPRNPDMVAVASFDGKITIHSLQGQGVATSADDDHSAIPTSPRMTDPNDPFAMIGQQHQKAEVLSGFTLQKPPKWLRKTSGATFGFGGKLASFSGSSVSISVPVVESALMDRINEIDSVTQNDATDGYRHFCAQMSEFSGEREAFTDRDRETWRFLRVMFEKSREQMLEFLGFSIDAPLDGKLKPLEDKLMALKLKEDELLASKPPMALPFSLYPTPSASASVAPGKAQEESDIDSLITKHCIVGEFEKAVNVCLAANRLSDALVIAVSGGQELLQKTQKEYFRRKAGVKSYIRLLQSVVDSDFDDVTNCVKLDDSGEGWKDTMAFVATYASSQELSRQFGILGTRLAEEARTPDAVRKSMPSKSLQGSKESKIHAAALCYIGSGDVEKAVDVWTRREVEEEYSLMKHSHASSRLMTHVTALQSLMEKVTILRKAINYVDPWVTSIEVPENGYPLDVLYSHLAEYSEILSSVGKLPMAWNVLSQIPDSYTKKQGGEDVDSLVALRDRVYKALNVKNRQAPVFPFETQEIISQEEIAEQEAIKNAAAAQAQKASTENYGYGQQANGYGYNQNSAYNSGYPSAAPAYGNAPGYQNQYAAPQPQSTYGYPQQPVQQQTSQYGYAPPQSSYNAPQSNFGQPQQVNAGFRSAPPPSVTPVAPPPKPAIFQPPSIPQSTGFAPQQPWMPPTQSQDSLNKPMVNAPLPPPPTAGQPWVPPPAGVPPFGAGPQNPGVIVPPPPVQQQQPMMPPMSRPASNRTSFSAQEPQVPQSAPPSQEKPAPEMPAGFRDISTGLEKHIDFLRQNLDAGSQKRIVDDVDKRIHSLFGQLSSKQVVPEVLSSLRDILKNLDVSDFAKAGQIQIDLMTRHFDKTGLWIMGIKRLIDSMEKVKSGAQMSSGQSPVTSPVMGHQTGNQAMPPPPGGNMPPGPPRHSMTGPPSSMMTGPQGMRHSMSGPQGVRPQPSMAGPPPARPPMMMPGPPPQQQQQQSPHPGPPSLNPAMNPMIRPPPPSMMNRPPPLMNGPPPNGIQQQRNPMMPPQQQNPMMPPQQNNPMMPPQHQQHQQHMQHPSQGGPGMRPPSQGQMGPPRPNMMGPPPPQGQQGFRPPY